MHEIFITVVFTKNVAEKAVKNKAVLNLARMACPQAGEEILAWISEAGLAVPVLPLQSALIQCSAERPQLLLPYLKHAERFCYSLILMG